MTEFPIFTFEDVDLDFKNASVKIVSLKNLQEFEITGVRYGPFSEGSEFVIMNWIASQLVKLGLAKFHEESLMNLLTLNKIHWQETKLQMGRQISSLPNFFYANFHRYLEQLKEKIPNNTEAASEFNMALRLFQDIVNCRLKKIVSLASSLTDTSRLLRNLSPEERILYVRLNTAILEWKSKILKKEAME